MTDEVHIDPSSGQPVFPATQPSPEPVPERTASPVARHTAPAPAAAASQATAPAASPSETTTVRLDPADLDRLTAISESVGIAAEQVSGAVKDQSVPEDPALRPGAKTTENRWAIVGTALGALLMAISALVPASLASALQTVGAILMGGSPPAYILSRGMAKGGARALAPLLLMFVGASFFLGVPGCKGPAKDTDYIRRDTFDGSFLLILDRHDAWAQHLVELGELDAGRAASYMRSTALARHLVTAEDPTLPIELDAAPEPPQTLPPSDHQTEPGAGVAPLAAPLSLPDPYADPTPWDSTDGQ